MRDLCVNINNHKNTVFHHSDDFLKAPLELLGVNLKNPQVDKICHFSNHPYSCEGLYEF